MREFMTALIECSVTMSVLVLGFIAATPWLSKRYSAKWLYYIWLVLVISLIIPFRVHPDTAFVQINDAPAYIQQIIPGNAGNIVDTTITTNKPSQELSTISWHQIGICLWVAGLLAFMIYHGLKHFRFLRMVSRWSGQPDKQMNDTLQKIKADMGITTPVKLQICSCISSPMMIGLIKPVILLPWSDFSEDELPYILKHELVHFKCKDLWYKSLVLFATAIHWFNPVMYIMVKAIASQCEISCDAEVVSKTDIGTRQQYSETIIGVIKNQSRMQTAFSTNFYGGKKGMKKRIFSIMDTSKKRAGALILSLVLVGTLGTGVAFAVNAEGKTNGNVTSSEELAYLETSEINSDLYVAYKHFGLTVNEHTGKLYYDGKMIRCFDDQIPAVNFSSKGIGYYERDGVIDVRATRERSTGELLGLEKLSDSEFQKRIISDPTQSDSQTGTDIFNEYKAFGLTYDSSQDSLFYYGERVRLFMDVRNSRSTASNLDTNGTIDVYAVRDDKTDGNGDKKLTGLRIATQDEFDKATKSMGQTTRSIESAK